MAGPFRMKAIKGLGKGTRHLCMVSSNSWHYELHMRVPGQEPSRDFNLMRSCHEDAVRMQVAFFVTYNIILP